MTLAEYLERGERVAFATRLGITAPYLHQICQHRRAPSWDLAVRISAETGGHVSIEELFGPAIPWPIEARLRECDPPMTPEVLDDLRRRQDAVCMGDSYGQTG